MSPKTEAAMNEMVAWANEGNDVIPAFFTWQFGRSACAAAVRAARKRGLLADGGRDGCGNPKYVAAVADMVPASAAVN
ncbi:MAG: hypothetical protein AAFX81_18915 [Pseudomonadota bacterium]